MDAAMVSELRIFVDQCKSNPSILRDPSLGFFKTYLESLGARIPSEPRQAHKMEDIDGDRKENKDHIHTKKPPASYDIDDEIVESDIELDGEVVEEDNDPPQKMGNPTDEVTDDRRDAAQIFKAKALDALSDEKLDEAIEHLTEAILLNPVSAILLSTRATIFLKMKKPNAAIRDANAALKINPDSAKGYKTRGIARAMLGKWEEAAHDLHLASTLDYDDEIASVLKKVEPNVRKLEDHRRKYERLRKEREMKKAEKERKQRQAEAQKQEPHSPESDALHNGTVRSVHSSAEFEATMKAASKFSRLLILYFTATWCGPCRYMGPIYTDLAGKYPAVVFLKVDIDELSEVAHRWNVSSVPTFFFVKKGKEIDKVMGADKNGLQKKIELHAKNA